MKKLLALTLMLSLLLVAIPASAHEAVEVSDQLVLDGWVTVDSVASDGPGWIVIHADNDGSFGPVIGYTHVSAHHANVRVKIDPAAATPVLYAMLHVDTGEAGVYEFGAVEGADGPVVVDGAPLAPAFNIQTIDARPQFVENTFTVQNVVTDAPGFVVVHQEAEGRPGPVLGAAPIEAGNNADVTVELEGDITANLWPMLHVDTGEAGVYEFGAVEGADGPIVVNGKVATLAIATEDTILALPQILVHGDNYASDMPMEDMAPTFFAPAVLAAQDGFLVVHQEVDGSFGPVAGVAPVSAGLNTDVVVELDPMLVTTRMWPMLHVDTGEAGVYEFGQVEGADGPVTNMDGDVVTFAVDVAPSWSAQPQAVSEDGTITIDWAVIDNYGWVAVHASVDGAPGPVIGVGQLNPGLNRSITISLDFSAAEGAASDQVFPMLHYDDNVVGEYEFGVVEGADGPVRVGESVVVGPLELQ